MSIKHSSYQRISARFLSDAQKKAARKWARSFGVRLRPKTTDAAQLQDIVANEPYVYDLKFIPDAIVDIGANVGFASLQLAEQYPGQPIYAFEPEPENYAMLVNNTRQLPEIQAIQAVVTPFPDQEIQCYNCGGEWGYVFESVREETKDDFLDIEISTMQCLMLDAISLQQIVEKYHINIDGNNLLKVNIAGFGHELFAGNTQWIDAFRAVAIRVPWPMRPQDQAAILEAFQKTRYAYTLRAFNTSLLFERDEIA